MQIMCKYQSIHSQSEIRQKRINSVIDKSEMNFELHVYCCEYCMNRFYLSCISSYSENGFTYMTTDGQTLKNVNPKSELFLFFSRNQWPSNSWIEFQKRWVIQRIYCPNQSSKAQKYLLFKSSEGSITAGWQRWTAGLPFSTWMFSYLDGWVDQVGQDG